MSKSPQHYFFPLFKNKVTNQKSKFSIAHGYWLTVSAMEHVGTLYELYISSLLEDAHTFLIKHW